MRLNCICVALDPIKFNISIYRGIVKFNYSFISQNALLCELITPPPFFGTWIATLFLLLTTFSVPLLGQTVCPADTELGSTIQFWDWTQNEEFTFYLNGVNGPVKVQTPFHLSSNSIPPNTNVYSLVAFDDQDFHPEDGWELLYRSFGTPDNKVPVASFALYNRYEGVIRQLTYAPNADDDFNYATSSIGLRGEISSDFTGNMLMAFANSPVKSLVNYQPNVNDGFTLVNQLTVGSFGFGVGTWIVAEAPVMYDPCVCLNASVIQSYSEARSISSITLAGTSTGYSEAVYGNGEMSSPFLAGSKIFGDFGKTFKKFKSVDAAKSDNETRGTSFVGSISSILTGGELAFKLLDFIVGGGKTSPPSIIGYKNNHSYNLGGNLTFEASIVNNGVYTPGSYQLGLPAELIPVYNNPLGVFAMVLPPQVKTYSYTEEDLSPFDYCEDRIVEVSKYLFDPSLFEYTINTAAGIDLIPLSIKGALKFTDCNSFVGSTAISGLVADEFERGTYTTPIMDLKCLAEYPVSLEAEIRDVITGSGCESVQAGESCKNVDLVLQIRLMPSNPLPGQDPIEIIVTLDVDEIPVPSNSIPDIGIPSIEEAIACTSDVIPPMQTYGNLGVKAFCLNRYNPKIVSNKNSVKSIDPELDMIGKVLSSSQSKQSNGEDFNQDLVSVYPNPTKSIVWVSVSETFANYGDFLHIKVRNTMGQLAFQTKVNYDSSNQRIELGGLPSGQYFIEIINTANGLRSTSMITKN